MRVAIVCPYDVRTPGGVQNHVDHLATELRRRGDETVIVAAGEPDEAPEGVVAVAPPWRVPFNDSIAPIALEPVAVRRTIAALREFEPDVTHVHEPAVPFVSLAATLRGPTPIVATFHAWSDRNLVYKLARPIVHRALDRLAVRIAVSVAAAGYHGASLGVPPGTFRIVPNGVDVGWFADAQPLDELRRADEPLLLFVGRLEPRKGLDPLVRAFVKLKARRPGIRLLVVGEGPERDRCQRLLPARLRSDVAFLGRVEPEELARFYATCDVFVSPALGGESFGIVLLEAMAAGTPVVASDIPGYRSVVRDGIDGRLVPPGDVDALAQALDSLLDNPALRGALAAEGAQRAQRYDWPRVVDELRELYGEVAED